MLASHPRLFGTSIVYFGGFYAKLSTPDFTFDLAWVWTDNLRNSIALPWLIWGKTIPPIPQLIINNQWAWKLAALGHVLTQALPIFALFALKRPNIRLAEGAIYVAGCFLLKEVMGFWNPPWILLTTFFIDWDFFLARLRLLPHPVRGDANSTRWRKLVLAYAGIFIAANLIVIVTRFDDLGRSRLYPLSSMTFYSNVAATKPYRKHHHYPFIYAELEIGHGNQFQKWFCLPIVSSSPTFALSGVLADKLEREMGAMEAVVEELKGLSVGTDCNDKQINVAGFDALDLYESILDIPPYPRKIAGFEIGFRALQARYERDKGRIIAAAAQIPSPSNAIGINVASRGLDVDHYEILLANDPWKNYQIGPLFEPKGEWEGDSFRVDLGYFKRLPPGWYPIVVRVIEKSGASYDFFGGVLYR